MSKFRTTAVMVLWGSLLLTNFFTRTEGSPASLPETMDKEVATDLLDARSMESSENEELQQPQKRSTLLLDRLVYALQKAIKQDAVQQTDMELTRRGPDRRVYWRCYFNAVSCFRRK